MLEIIMDTLHDILPMLPFLYITYYLMEYLEHHTTERFKQRLESAKQFGPLIGAVLGIVPQCGFSVLASGLYMNKSITLGTLIAVFVSTSDEAIPILISQPSQFPVLLKVIIMKVVVAIIAGYSIDFLIKRKYIRQYHTLHNIHETCERERVQHHTLAYIACKHTIKILVFIFVVNVVLSAGISYIGSERLGAILASGSIFQPMIAAFVGFIPNCAASVILVQLSMEGILSFGALCAGLITSAGLGLLVLFKMYDNKKDILRIMGILFIVAILSGSLLQWCM